VLNDSGLHIAEDLLREQSPEPTIDRLVDEYGISRDSVRKDVMSVLDHLKQEGFWDEQGRQPMIRTPELRSLFLHLTSRCNMSCGHCYATPDVREEEPGTGDQDLPAEKVIALIDQCLAAGARGITFSGGEPLCHPQIMPILRYAASRMDVQLLTNGSLIDQIWASTLADLGVRISISLDGSRPEIHDQLRGKGRFSRTMHSIELLLRAGASGRMSINTTVTRQNFHDLQGLISLAQQLSLPLIRFLPLRRVGRADEQGQGMVAPVEDYEAFFASTSRWQEQHTFQIEVSCGLSGVVLKGAGPMNDALWCPVGHNLVVDHRGDAFPCVLLMRDAFKLGNIFQQDLQQMVRSSAMAEVCDTLARRRQEIESCRPCCWRNLCQGGCMGQALEHKATVWQADHFCAYRQRAYGAAFDKICSLHRSGRAPGRGC